MYTDLYVDQKLEIREHLSLKDLEILRDHCVDMERHFDGSGKTYRDTGYEHSDAELYYSSCVEEIDSEIQQREEAR